MPELPEYFFMFQEAQKHHLTSHSIASITHQERFSAKKGKEGVPLQVRSTNLTELFNPDLFTATIRAIEVRGTSLAVEFERTSKLSSKVKAITIFFRLGLGSIFVWIDPNKLNAPPFSISDPSKFLSYTLSCICTLSMYVVCILSIIIYVKWIDIVANAISLSFPNEYHISIWELSSLLGSTRLPCKPQLSYMGVT